MDRPVTATTFAIHETKRLIVERVLPPGERIDQADLAQRLDLSRIPIRQALVHLAGQGFVQLRDRRSAIVRPVSGRDMRQLYELRVRLERWGFERDFDRFDADRLDRLKANLESTERCVADDDHKEFLARNRDFHFTTYEVVENAYLADSIRDLFDLSERYHWLCTSAPGMMRNSLEEHRAILEAVCSGDLKEFLSRHEAHSLKTIQWVEEHGLVDLPA